MKVQVIMTMRSYDKSYPETVNKYKNHGLDFTESSIVKIDITLEELFDLGQKIGQELIVFISDTTPTVQIYDDYVE